LELLADTGKKLLGDLASASLEMLKTGEFNFQALKKMVLSGLLDMVDKQVTIMAPAIFATIQGWIPPPFGTIAAGVALAGIKALLALGRSAVGKARHGGTVPGTKADIRKGDTVPYLLTATEEILSPETSDRYRAEIAAMRAGRLEEHFLERHKGKLVDGDGKLRTKELEREVARQGAAIAELGGIMRDGLEALAAAQDRTAAGTHRQVSVQFEGELRGDGRSIAATIEDHKLADLSFR
jgi:hypothetical protein